MGKNIHIIYTTSASRLHDTFNSLRLESGYDFSPRNLNVYVTKNDEDIHDGDFIITAKGVLVHVTYLLSPDLEGAAKVVLTSDPALTREGVQLADDDFLQWFVKNPSCEVVEVDKVKIINYSFPRDVYNKYKIIIPSEEPKKETLEEYFLGKIKEVLQFDNDAQAIRFMEKYFEAKKEQEGFHTDKDIINALHSVELKDNRNYIKIHEGMKEWFEKNKNK